jgi:hypothetical protein
MWVAADGVRSIEARRFGSCPTASAMIRMNAMH